MAWLEDAKKRAAVEATENVEDGFVVGLGSGTTAAHAIQELGRKRREEELQIMGVPTSVQAFQLAVDCRIPVTTLDEYPILDVTIDGADQVDERLDMIKGMGGALTREKIVASASKMNVIVVDETKMTSELGIEQPVPVEVLPFALSVTMSKLRLLDGEAVLRKAEKMLGPAVTDNANFIVDVDFGEIKEPKKLDQKLKSIPGVIETGIFAGMADVVYVGGADAVKKLQRRSAH